MTPLYAIIGLATALVLLPLCALGLHRLVLVWRRWRPRRPLVACGATELPEPTPRVTVQLPIYNERRVARRVIEAAAALDYPRDCLEIQVLDDSDDDTGAICDGVCAELRTRGLDVRVLRRADRHGFKAGALEHGLSRARGDLLAVFDADFVPDPQFLRRVVPHFAAPEIGMVQVRWGHLNRDRNLLTRVEALLLDGHFLLESAVRHTAGLFFNFNGTAGVWRRSAIEAAGGWSADTLTEDLDLSYRAQLAGYRFRFIEAPAVPAELPETMSSFKTQQHRWTKGSIQVGKKLGRRLLFAGLGRGVTCEALLHLWSNLAFPLVLLLSLILPLWLFARLDAGLVRWWPDWPLLGLATLPVIAFYASAARLTRRGWLATLWSVPAAMALGIGMSVNNSGAVIEALLGRASPFLRTPKRGDAGAGVGTAAYPLPRVAVGIAELALALYYGTALTWSLVEGLWGAAPFLALFGAGFAAVGVASAVEQRRR